MGCLILIGDNSIQNSILYRTFQSTDFTTGLQAESFHDLFPTHRRLEITDTVLFFKVFQLLANQLEVIQKSLLALHVFRSDIRFAKCHQVVDIIPRLKKQTAYGRIRHDIIRYHNGTHVQADHFLHILHLFIHRQLHLPENIRNHLLTDKIMIMERPARFRLPTFRCGLGDIVQQSCPTQPEIIRLFADIVQHFQRMVKIVLVRPSVSCFYSLQGSQFRKNQRQQSASFQFYKAF